MIKTSFRIQALTVLLATCVFLPAACTDANNNFVFDATPVDAGKGEGTAPNTLEDAARAADVAIQPLDTAPPDSSTILMDTGAAAVADVAGWPDTSPEAAIQPTIDATRIDSAVDNVDAGTPGRSDASVSDSHGIGTDVPADASALSEADTTHADADID